MFKKTTKQSLIVSRNEMSEGLFGMVILYLFEVLPILENEEIDVSNLHWDIQTLKYGSIFPDILGYKSELPRSGFFGVRKIKLSDLRKSKPQYVLGDDFVELNKLFFKYFTIPAYLDEIALGYNLDGYTGLHFRGTDKIGHIDNTTLTKEDFFEIIDSYIVSNGISKIFIASDEADILDTMKKKYPDVEFKSSREFTNIYSHHDNPDAEKNAKEAMIDMLCLSKCKTVLKASSALSAWTKVINPNIEVYRLNGLKMFTDIPYFPEAYIPLLPTNDSYSKKCNDILTKVQKGDWSFEHGSKFNSFFVKQRE